MASASTIIPLASWRRHLGARLTDGPYDFVAVLINGHNLQSVCSCAAGCDGTYRKPAPKKKNMFTVQIPTASRETISILWTEATRCVCTLLWRKYQILPAQIRSCQHLPFRARKRLLNSSGDDRLSHSPAARQKAAFEGFGDLMLSWVRPWKIDEATTDKWWVIL